MNKKRKKALITGITGQDGSYLAEFLLQKGYEVHGLKEDQVVSILNGWDIFTNPKHEDDNHLFLHCDELIDSSNILRIIKANPDEIYNLGAQVYVAVSLSLLNILLIVMPLGH